MESKPSSLSAHNPFGQKALEPNHPRRNALHVEPFPYSTHWILTNVQTTTTKICTRGTVPGMLTHCTLHNCLHDMLPLTPFVGWERTNRHTRFQQRSILKANQFGQWVVTHSWDDANFHGHILAVWIDQHFSIIERALARHYRLVRLSPFCQPCLPTLTHLGYIGLLKC